MPNIKEFLRQNSLSTALSVLTVLIASVSFFLVSIKTQELSTAKKTLGKANDQIAKLTEDLGTLTTDVEQAKKNEAAAKAKTNSLSADLEAFAKQAATCEALKKQIKPKK